MRPASTCGLSVVSACRLRSAAAASLLASASLVFFFVQLHPVRRKLGLFGVKRRAVRRELGLFLFAHVVSFAQYSFRNLIGIRIPGLPDCVDVIFRDRAVSRLEAVLGDDALAQTAEDAAQNAEGSIPARRLEHRCGELDHGVRPGRKLRGRQAGYGRARAAQKSEVNQIVVEEGDGAVGVAPAFDELAERRLDIPEPGLQPVADPPDRIDPAVSRVVGLGMADHNRSGIAGGVVGND